MILMMLECKSSSIVKDVGSLVVTISILVSLMSVSAAFDLNEMPDDEFDVNLDNYPISTTTTTTTPKPTASDRPQSVTSKVTPAQYAKVQALFKLLQVCDIPNFDIRTIHLPESFAKENKAMMALKEVAKRNLIAKQDKERFERIMKNCGQLAKAVHINTDKTLGGESQQSGGYDEEKEAKRLYEDRNSPLANFENRFSNADLNPEVRRLPTKRTTFTTTTTTTTASPVPQEVVQDGVTIFKFL